MRETAAWCWAGVPGDVLRLQRGQHLAGSRLVTSLFLVLFPGLLVLLVADKVEIVSQCRRCQYMCRRGSAGEAWEYRSMPRDSLSVKDSPALDLRRASFRALPLVSSCLLALMWEHNFTERVHSQMRVSARRMSEHMHCQKTLGALRHTPQCIPVTQTLFVCRAFMGALFQRLGLGCVAGRALVDHLFTTCTLCPGTVATPRLDVAGFAIAPRLASVTLAHFGVFVFAKS